MDGAAMIPNALPPLHKYHSLQVSRGVTSGYLGGVHKGGFAVERLANKWRKSFQVEHAIPCNSATSGLLAACMAAGVGPLSAVWTTPFSMSATAACARVLGANVSFIDIENIRYGIHPDGLEQHKAKLAGITPRAVIVANILGHPAYLREIREWCGRNHVTMIEDNAQAPFATENGRLTGTIGHIGVFSLNVHKHFQCGEGGVVVTNEPNFADRVYDAINHGELSDNMFRIFGLNLRMTEDTARTAWTQLLKGPRLVKGRRDLAHALSEQVTEDCVITPPKEDTGCVSSFYIWAARMKPQYTHLRNEFVELLQSKQAPFKAGYSPLLTRIIKSNDECPMAETVESELVTFETCAWDPAPSQITQIGDIFRWASNEIIAMDHQKRGAA
jgi:perosamine synthetase